MVAAVPVMISGYRSDWTRLQVGPRSRSEFLVGDDFVAANGVRSCFLIFLARCACIPFSTTGAFIAYLWAKRLYGGASGITALAIYTFEPNLLAHGSLITSDAACTAIGLMAGYAYWSWLRNPRWGQTFIAGIALGLAQMTKMSWLILFALWPVIFVAWRMLPSAASHDSTANPPRVSQLAVILTIAIYVICMGYGFEGVGHQLKDFDFCSQALSGRSTAGLIGNRFRGSPLGIIPVPLPAQYLLGLDSQKVDLEGFGELSYLRGSWSDHGWWYYYLYGLLVKLPLGLWAIFVLVIMCRAGGVLKSVSARDEIALILPGVSLLAIVSSQTAFSIHLRYALPFVAVLAVFCAQVTSSLINRSRPLFLIAVVALSWMACSSMRCFPDLLTYFNEAAGGSKNGHNHLLGSSLDWGQATGQAMAWINQHYPESTVQLQTPSKAVARVLLKEWMPNSEPAITLTVYSADTFYSEKRMRHLRKDGNAGGDVVWSMSGMFVVRPRTEADQQ